MIPKMHISNGYHGYKVWTEDDIKLVLDRMRRADKRARRIARIKFVLACAFIAVPIAFVVWAILTD